MRSRRAWIYVLSVLALLVPAGGIAYLGAFSYQNDRGAVSAQTERQKQAAEEIATRIERSIDDAFAAIESATARTPLPHGPLAAPLAQYWFWIDPTGHLVVPRAASDDGEILGSDRAPCTERLEDCVRQASERQARLAKLAHAMRAESCTPATCAAAWNDARRAYGVLADFADTGPQALLGLARVYHRMEDERGEASALETLEKRYADRTIDDLPVKLVVAMMRASGHPAELLSIGEDVAARHYALSPAAALGTMRRIVDSVGHDVPPALTRRVAALEEDMTAIRIEARAAAGLVDDVPALMRDAIPAWRGRPATRQPARTLIYRRRGDGSIVGIAVDGPMLEAAGGPGRDDIAVNARAIVLPIGTSPPGTLRELAQVPLGEKHLAVHLVNPMDDPDPLDEVIRARSKRHVAYTSALAVMLGLGLLATIFGAARARELAQLKSDFVSTVSHELKTPLTSIRMFAEMLEQGVAQGDTGKMARYHHVIVQESQRLGLLIANLLDYAQIERGTRRYALTRENIGTLARDAVSTFETLQDPEKAKRNPVTVSVSSTAMSAHVEVDRDVVIQALLNLLANAAKYGAVGATRDVNTIEVSVDADSAGTSIAVRDHGPGIPAHEQARIFREFYRAPEAYTSGIEGTGLGLALVKQHIEALGGSVEVHSVVGEGATFTVRLPAREAA